MSKKVLSSRRLYSIIFVVIVLVIIAIIVGPMLFPSNTPYSLPDYGKAQDFTMPNVLNQTYTLSSDQGLVRIMTFIYTRCPDSCPLLTSHFASLEATVAKNNLLNKTRFITIDFDYINDTLSILHTFASKYTNDFTRWQFLLGNKTETLNTTKAYNYYFGVNNGTDPTNTDPYIHSVITYIIDKNGNIRDELLGDTWSIGINGVFTAVKYLIDH